jgi:hypothetical protein
VTYPEAAKVFCNDVYYGITPLELDYKIGKEHNENNVLNPMDCKAVWSSGAKGTFELVDGMSLSDFPDGIIIIANRDTFDGFEQDRKVASDYSRHIYTHTAWKQQEHQSRTGALNTLNRGVATLSQSLTNSSNPSGANSNNKSNILYDSSGCTGVVVNGSCTGYITPYTPKFECHGYVLPDGTCSGTMQRKY